MPVARGTRFSARSAVIVGGAGVISAVILLLFVLWAAGQNSGRSVQTSDTQFQNISAAKMAKSISKDGPVLFPDASGNRSRDIYVQHLGDDPTTGWLAFDAHKPGASRDCYLEWHADRQVFVDVCDKSEVPADGTGLRQYPATVNKKGTLVIDFNPDRSATTTVTRLSSVTASR
jgi:hypothetical protein